MERAKNGEREEVEEDIARKHSQLAFSGEGVWCWWKVARSSRSVVAVRREIGGAEDPATASPTASLGEPSVAGGARATWRRGPAVVLSPGFEESGKKPLCNWAVVTCGVADGGAWEAGRSMAARALGCGPPHPVLCSLSRGAPRTGW